MKKIFFRADAGIDIGYGHFIRTLALADMLKDNFECTFFTQSPTEYQIQELSKVCNYVALPSNESKLEIFLKHLSGDEIVVLDNYFFTTDYQLQIKAKGCKLVCIDDMHNRHYVADVVINHGCSNRELFSVEPYTKLCLGLDWALLRRDFLEAILNKDLNHRDKIVVNFGGSDQHDFAWHFAQQLQDKFPNYKIVAILGDQYKGKLNNNSINIKIEKNLNSKELVELFLQTKYAFLSASTICIEALSCGVKIASGYYVDNQEGLYRELEKQKYIYPLDSLFNTPEINSNAIENFSFNDLHIGNIRQNYIDLFSSLNEIMNFNVNNLAFVNYINLPTDLHREIWSERNKIEIREWMDNPNEFPFESHLKFTASLAASKSTYWAIFTNNKLVGSVNISKIDSESTERGIFLSTEYLNKRGYGSLIEESLDIILQSLNYKKIIAKVLKSNTRSINFHIKNNYKPTGEDSRYQYFEKSYEK